MVKSSTNHELAKSLQVRILPTPDQSFSNKARKTAFNGQSSPDVPRPGDICCLMLAQVSLINQRIYPVSECCGFFDFCALQFFILVSCKHIKRKHISRYLELQYHGDLTIDCVESLTFPYDLKDGKYSKFLSIAEKWKDVGAKIFYIDDNYNLKQL